MNRPEWLLVFVIFSIYIISLPNNACEAQLSKSTQARVVSTSAESCYTIRGRLAMYNGNPTLRIWVVGTHRVLAVNFHGVNGVLSYDLPDTLVRLLTSWEEETAWHKRIFGNFTVCPLEKYRSGWMQAVSVNAVSNINITDDRKNSKR